MTDTFTWSVYQGTSSDATFRTRKAQFGDGYSQAAGDGLNTEVQKWNIKIDSLTSDEIAPILTFIRDHKGYQSFYWTPPDGEQGLYRCESYNLTPEIAGYRTLTATFQQVFAP